MRRHQRPTVIEGGAGSVSALDIISHVLDRGEHAMKTRYQDPKILTRTDVRRPFYYILASVPVVTPGGIQRKRQSFQLGFCDEISMKQARGMKQQILAPVNAGRSLIQSQVPFRDVARRFEEVRIPQLGVGDTEQIPNAPSAARLAGLRRDDAVRDQQADDRGMDQQGGRIEDVTVKRDGVEVTVERDGLGWWARLDLRNLLSALFTKAAEWKLWDERNPWRRLFPSGKRR